MASAARTAAVCFADAERAITAVSPLRQLVEQAIATKDASRAYLHGDRDWSNDVEQDQSDRLDRAAMAANQALLDHLLNEHGIGTALVRRLGQVL